MENEPVLLTDATSTGCPMWPVLLRSRTSTGWIG